jgi:hypothetical protein
VDMTQLNQRLVDEISSLQIRMIEVLRENFQLKAENDILKRSGSVGGPVFPTIRKHRSPRSNSRYIGRHSASPYGQGWTSSSESVSSWDIEEELSQLSRRVGEMDDLVSRLNQERASVRNGATSFSLPPTKSAAAERSWPGVETMTSIWNNLTSSNTSATSTPPQIDTNRRSTSPKHPIRHSDTIGDSREIPIEPHTHRTNGDDSPGGTESLGTWSIAEEI